MESRNYFPGGWGMSGNGEHVTFTLPHDTLVLRLPAMSEKSVFCFIIHSPASGKPYLSTVNLKYPEKNNIRETCIRKQNK